MEASVPGRLAGWDIHGFRTMKDLDMNSIMEEASGRWLRPNEIHAILCNHKHFSVHVKPVNLPKSGTIVLFDRKMLRNFRRDGHNWKKKKDGKTVKEAHEHLKVGNEERIHVYYAHGQDSPTFVRRCYWLLDKTLEHVVLVHYRETKETLPVTPVHSSSGSAPSEPSSSWHVSEESDTAADQAYYASSEPPSEPYGTVLNHEMRLHEINTLEWDELLANDTNKIDVAPGEILSQQQNQYETNGYRSNVFIENDALLQGNPLSGLSGYLLAESHIIENQSPLESNLGNNYVPFNLQEYSQRKEPELVGPGSGGSSLEAHHNDELQTQDSFGRWMNYIMSDPSELLGGKNIGQSISTSHEFESEITVNQHHQSPVTDYLFNVTEVSPAWALSTETTKILVVGLLNEGIQNIGGSSLLCVCGDACVSGEIVQPGVFRFFVPPHNPGAVNLFLSFDGQKPISQVLDFEYRSPVQIGEVSSEHKTKFEEIRVQMRLAHLLFSTSKSLQILSNKVSQNALKNAKLFAGKTAHIIKSWENLIKSVEDNKISFSQAKDNLFEIALHNRLLEWLLERVVDGCKISERDDQGQGVIHLCAILGYKWAVYPFSWSGLSLDHRDKNGWTALHWAAYHGREKMVATLLSAGAKPNLVTDPTSEDRGGCTAADLASKKGYEGLAAYLAEKGLVDHFQDMSIAGNVSGSLPTTTTETVDPSNLSEEDRNLKDTLTAYRTAADAAARIQAAIRDHELKLRTKEVHFTNPEDEARNIIAAMRIQHAYRHHDTRKKMVAAARIQYRFRTWKIRKEFINMRRQATKIQALFRGFQVRRQYRKILWSVGVLEKAILRWRLKRKGFRGLQVEEGETKVRAEEEAEVESFFQASMKQAEERVERSVVKVQALFRSKRAQEDYHRMKQEHLHAKLEYEELLHLDTDMG